MIPLGVLAARRSSGASGGSIFADDFNRPDGAIGGDWAAILTAALPVVSSNRVVYPGSAARARCIHAATADHYVQAVRPPIIDARVCGVLARVSTTTRSYYLARIYNGNAELQRWASGTSTLLGSYSVGSKSSVSSLLRIECVGSTITVKVDGETVISVSDPGSPLEGNTYGGLDLTGFGGELDDFEIGDL